tara:strand:- start:2769 stop:3086 length:318 start_codon:yes stop_codon:yes gene_type:complete
LLIPYKRGTLTVQLKLHSVVKGPQLLARNWGQFFWRLNMADFINGLMAKKPNEKAPAFVKCNLSIKRVELIAWLSEKSDDWINVQVKESGRTGNWYAEIDNWKPK